MMMRGSGWMEWRMRAGEASIRGTIRTEQTRENVRLNASLPSNRRRNNGARELSTNVERVHRFLFRVAVLQARMTKD